MLVTEAKLILEKVGYTADIDHFMTVHDYRGIAATLIIKDGAVNKDEVMNLLDERGYSVQDGQFHPTDADIGIYD